MADYAMRWTPWAKCAPCDYCHAATGEPCINMRATEIKRTCLHPHPTRRLRDEASA